MAVDVAYAAGALKALRRMPAVDARRLRDAVRQVAEAHPVRMPFVTEMVGEPGAWRVRKGSWRAVYVIEGDRLVVRNVGHRSEVYD